MFSGFKKKDKNEKLPTVRVTDMKPDEVFHDFHLKPGGDCKVFNLGHNETRHVPDHLRQMLSDFALATRGSDTNGALMRCRIDAIILTCLAAQKRESSHQSGSSILSVHLQLETGITFPWIWKGVRKEITGVTDYSLWYATPGEKESNLLVVEAKKKGTSGDYQALAYMGMLHHARRNAGRKDVSMFGIATDSFDWSFIHIDNNGKVSKRTYNWDNANEASLIISIIHKVIRQAAHLSRQSLNDPTARSGFKRTLSGHSKLDFLPRVGW